MNQPAETRTADDVGLASEETKPIQAIVIDQNGSLWGPFADSNKAMRWAVGCPQIGSHGNFRICPIHVPAPALVAP